MRETCVPARLISACPSGIRYSASGTSHFSPYSRVFSMNITGSLSRMEVLRRPFPSYAVAGATTFSPGVLARKFSGVFEWVAPTLVPPLAVRRSELGSWGDSPHVSAAHTDAVGADA